MVKLVGDHIYLGPLEREHCRRICSDNEYDFEQRTELLYIGHSAENGDRWYQEIQEFQGKRHIRLGIFLPDGTVIGDIALQDIEWFNRCCSIGYGLTKLSYRNRGHTSEAAGLILDYAFRQLGLERVEATTLAHNFASQRILKKWGFQLEGIQRQRTYFGGERHDRYFFGLLREEYISRQ